MIASLGMYDFPPLQAANDRLWAGIRNGLCDRGVAAPDRLTRGGEAFWVAWQSQELVLSQTCGYPLRARLHGRVILVGTPDFGVPECKPGYYRSVFIARADDPRETVAEYSGSRFAYNEDLSQSGWAAPQNHAVANGLRFPPALHTGEHRLSARAVAEGRADLAAIDAVTWALLVRHDEVTRNLKVVGHTDPTPGLPYIAALGSDGDALFAAIGAAIADLSPADRDLLHLRGIVRIPIAEFLSVPVPSAPDAIALAMN